VIQALSAALSGEVTFNAGCTSTGDAILAATGIRLRSPPVKNHALQRAH
jgi:hypothetical protein